MLRFPAVDPGDDVAISATSFVTFSTCAERAAARLRGEYGPDSRAGFVGGLSHRIFARHLAGGSIAPESFATACREEIGSGMNAKLGSLGMRPSELRSVIEEVGALYERFKAMPYDGFSGAEVALEAVPAPGVRLHGMIDAVFADTGGVRLVDWKTGGLGQDAAVQLDFYALLWTLEREAAPDRLEAVSVKSGERLEAVPSQDGLEATATAVAAMVNRLRASWRSGEPLERTAGPWCQHCPVLGDCVDGRSAVDLLAMTATG